MPRKLDSESASPMVCLAESSSESLSVSLMAWLLVLRSELASG